MDMLLSIYSRTLLAPLPLNVDSLLSFDEFVNNHLFSYLPTPPLLRLISCSSVEFEDLPKPPFLLGLGIS